MSNDADRHNAEVRLRTAALDFGLARDDEYSAASVELLAAAKAYAAVEAPTPRAPLDRELQRLRLQVRGLTEHLQSVCEAQYGGMGVPNAMDLPSGPVCYCGLPSRLECGECGEHGGEATGVFVESAPAAAPNAPLDETRVKAFAAEAYEAAALGLDIAAVIRRVAAAAPRDEALDVAARELANAARSLVAELHDGALEEAREAWGNTNAACAKHWRDEVSRLLLAFHRLEQPDCNEPECAAYRQARTAAPKERP